MLLNSSQVFSRFEQEVKNVLVYIKKECGQNWLTFFLPLPVIVIGWLWMAVSGKNSFQLGFNGSIVFLTVFFILSLIYGIQCFSSEKDRYTLDFILTRPLSPNLIVFCKYFLSLAFLLLWWFWSNSLIIIDLAKLSLPRGFSNEWLLLLILIIHAMSFFSGLLSKGLERLFVTVVLTSSVSILSYYFWDKAFNLLTANYYFLDVPPGLQILIMRHFPIILTVLSLAVPLVGAIWYLRRRVQIWLFRPALALMFAWFLVYLLLVGAEYYFSPVLWPAKAAKYGVWHEKTGILLVTTKNPRYEFHQIRTNEKVSFQIKLAIPHRKPRIIYSGINLKNPQISPDGRYVVFSENGQLKILKINNFSIRKIALGNMAVWSQNSREIIFSRLVGHDFSDIYKYSLKEGKLVKIPVKPIKISALAWDTEAQKLYIFDFNKKISQLNLKNGVFREIVFKKEEQPLSFEFIRPTIFLNPLKKQLFFGQVFQDVNIYSVNTDTLEAGLFETKSDFRIKSNAPLIFNNDFTAMLWQRIDGSFQYEATYLATAHHNHSGDEDGD